MTKKTEYENTLAALDDLEAAATACRDGSKFLDWEYTFSADILAKISQLRDSLQFHKVAEMSMHPKGPNPAEVARAEKIRNSKVFKKAYKTVVPERVDKNFEHVERTD